MFYFSNNEKKQRVERLLYKVCSLFLGLFFLTNKKIMLSSSRGHGIFEDFRDQSQGQGLENVLKAKNVFEDCTSADDIKTQTKEQQQKVDTLKKKNIIVFS